MPRRLRSQPTGLIIHVIGRGCRGMPVFGDLTSRSHFLYLLGDAVERFDWQILNWVLMTNHHHLVVQLREPNLAEGMGRIHGLYAQRWNEREKSIGHVWMSRYKSIPILKEGYAETLMRYVDLNPVRAGICKHPAAWEWGGYAANVGLRAPLPFHDAKAGRRVISAGADSYRDFVCDKIPEWAGCGHVDDERPQLREIIVPGDSESLDEAMTLWGYSALEIADIYGVTAPTVRNWRAKGAGPPLFPG